MVVKRPNTPYWHTNFILNGVRVQRSTKCLRKADAEAFAMKLHQDLVRQSITGVHETWTVEQATRGWLKAEGMRLADARNNESRAAKLLGRALDESIKRPGLPADKPLHALTLADLRRLKDARVQEGNSPATINKEMALVQSIVKYAKARGVRVPLDLPIRELYEDTGDGKLRWFTEEEEGRILFELGPRTVVRVATPGLEPVIRQDQLDLFILLLDTGARYTEGATIPWDVVDLKRGTINLYRSKVGNASELALTHRLADILQRRYAELRMKSPYVFPSRTLRGVVNWMVPRGYAPHGIERAIERAGCNLPHLVERFGRATPHTTRDTFATRLVREGVSLYKVQKLLGHASPQMTQKYAHLAPSDAAAEAADVLNRLHAKREFS